MRTVRLDVPKEVEAALAAAGYNTHVLSGEARRSLAATLYHRKVLTLEQAAQLARMALWEFIPFLGELGLPVANYDDEEAHREVEAARWLATRKRRCRS